MTRPRSWWPRRKSDWAWRVLATAGVALSAELGTGLGRWLWGRLWTWLITLTRI